MIVMAIAAWTLVSVFSLPHFTMNMSMDADGNMSMMDCYMPGMTAVCTMSPLEHIARWQGMFASTPAQSLTLSLLLLVLAVVLGFICIKQTHSPPLALQKARLSPRRRKYVPLHSSLQELFSSGILNPKLF